LSVKGDLRAPDSRLPLRKYYLHIASEFTVYADDRGVILSDLAAAYRCAVSVISNCMRCDPEEQDWRGWHVKIADDTGRTLVIVLFPTVRCRMIGPRSQSQAPTVTFSLRVTRATEPPRVCRRQRHMRFTRVKHVGRGVFRIKHLPRCKCLKPDGNGDGVCRSCGLAVLNPLEKENYRRAYPTTARMIDGEPE
jgi:hypothetical protein